MLKFFRGGKRITGLATLLLACVFAVLWTRTQFVIDTIDFGAFTVQVSIVSEIDAIMVTIWREDSKPFFRCATEGRVFIGARRAWYEPRFEFSVNESQRYFSLPHWAIITPLTLLFAWLLLSKPRATQLSEPTLPE